MTLRVLDIVGGTSVDGPGLRTSVYLAGCVHRCPGCHNPQSWEMSGGKEMSVDEIIAVIDENDFNVTLTGGDPMCQAEGVAELARRLKEAGRNVWCYTGYTYEEVCGDAVMSSVLPYVDVLVDGEFERAKRDTGLRFRGSSNQRLVDVARSAAGMVTLWDD